MADAVPRHRFPARRPVSTPSFMSPTRRFLGSALLLVGISGCMNPRIQAAIAQNMTDIANEMNAQRQDMALLQEQIDSLKLAMAHQDTVIKRLINITGLPPGNWDPATGSASVADAWKAAGRRYLKEEQPPEHRLRARDP